MAVSNKASPRKYTRYGTDLQCRFRIEGTFPWLDGVLVNLSKGGTCLKAKGCPAKGDDVELEVTLITDDGKWTKRKMRATSMWQRGIRAGLKFKVDKPKR